MGVGEGHGEEGEDGDIEGRGRDAADVGGGPASVEFIRYKVYLESNDLQS